MNIRGLKKAETQAETAKIGAKNVKGLYEGNFIKNAANKAKEFLKTGIKNVKQSVHDLAKKFSQSKKPDNFLPGKMIVFNYSAKDVEKKYDKNPLVISLGYSQHPKYSKTHFFGLNMHWLPLTDRVAVASFFTELNAKKKGELNYSDVKPFMRKFKGHPVLRQYIIKNISNRVIEMPSDLFLRTASIPSEEWIGK